MFVDDLPPYQATPYAIHQEYTSTSIASPSPFLKDSPLSDSLQLQVVEFFKQLNGKGCDAKQASHILEELAMAYLQAGELSRFHSYDSLSKSITQLEDADYSIILSELLQLAYLKHSIPSLKASCSSQEEAESFILNLMVRREAEMQLFLQELLIKNKFQAVLQTIKSIYLSELNEVERYLKERFSLSASDPYFLPLQGKKVLIFTCSYGTGHNITALGIKQMLEKKGAECFIQDLSTGLFLGKDRFRAICTVLGINYNDHPLNGVDIFNEILKNQLYFIVNTKEIIELFVRDMFSMPGKSNVVKAVGVLKNSWEKEQIRAILNFIDPDLVMTVYHMDLHPMLEAAEGEKKIPLLHIPTDYDMKFREVFGKVSPSYVYFRSLIPNYEVSDTIETKVPLSIDRLIEGVGIPLRTEFYQEMSEEEKVAYRHSHGITEREKILYLSAGGNGQHLPHPELLANSATWDIPLRVVVIAGKNREFVQHLQTHLQSIQGNSLLLRGSNPYVTIEIMRNAEKVGTPEEFFISADELSKMLDITHASIAKAGGLSTAELLFKGGPILFDQRKTPFIWEQFNIKIAVLKNIAKINYTITELEQDLKLVLELPKVRSEHFYFPNAPEILSQSCVDFIAAADIHRQQRNISTLASYDLLQMSDEELDQNWKLGDYFGEIKIITGSVQSDRFKTCKEELQKIGLPEGSYTVFPGVNRATVDRRLWERADNWEEEDTDWQKQGRTACFLAHYNAIKDSFNRLQAAQKRMKELRKQKVIQPEEEAEVLAQIKKYSSLLIIEDNAGFGQLTSPHEASLKGMGRRLRETLNELPLNWDMFYFIVMADDWGPSTEVAPHLLRLNYGALTKCFAINSQMYPVILKRFEELFASDLPMYPVDHHFANLHQDFNCFAPKGGMFAYRFGSWSEVQYSQSIEHWQPVINKMVPQQ